MSNEIFLKSKSFEIRIKFKVYKGLTIDLTSEHLKKIFKQVCLKLKTSKKLKLKYWGSNFHLNFIDRFYVVDKIYTIELKNKKYC